jgi:hypothetical protein
MNSSLQRLVDALREELQHYGGVLTLLDGVPPHPLGPGAAPLPDLLPVEPFRDAASQLLDARSRRERRQQQLAWACRQPDAWEPVDLLPAMPKDSRPLLRALFDEIDSLQDQLRDRLWLAQPWLSLPADAVLAARLLAPSTHPIPFPVPDAGFRRPRPDALSA